MKKFTAVFSLMVIGCSALAQSEKEIHLHINHKLAGQPLELNQEATNNLSQTFTISRVDYYISGISIMHDGGQVTNFPGVYILSKGNNPVSEMLGMAEVDQLESISFGIGVETPVNNEDPALWPSDHPLAYQSPSMHWGWSSGYRFACVEGQAGSFLGTNYQLHGLWNDNYFVQTVTTSGMVDGNTIHIALDADYAEALRDIDLASGPISHGDNESDLTMLTNFRNYVFSPGTVMSVENVPAFEMSVYPNPTQGMLTISGFTGSGLLTIADMTGRQVFADRVVSGQAVTLATAGVYIAKLTGPDGQVHTHKIMVRE